MKYRIVFLCLGVAALQSSCVRQHPVSSKILELYSQVRIGMPQQQVEEILGNPLFPPIHQPEVGPEYLAPGGTHPERYVCWYLDEPERNMERHESPWGLGGIKIVYREGKVIKKKDNFQWIRLENIEAFEKRTADQQSD